MSFQGYRDLQVYQLAFSLSMEIFRLTKDFPKNEQWALRDQIVRSSRSVTANLAEGWKKRQYEKMFVSKVLDAAGEAGETEVWLDYALECGYIDATKHNELKDGYDRINAMLYRMWKNPGRFCL
jgi:four helix bundle protein